MNSKRKLELDIFNGLLFLVSPILAIPSLIIGLIRSTRFSPFYYSLFVAFLSFLYKPTIQMDKARHLDFYNYSKYFTLQDFFIFNFKESPDFLFQLLLYLGAINNIRVHYIILMVTFITVYLIFNVFFDFLKKNSLSNNYTVVAILLFVFSLPYIDIFSGIRYTLAVGFVFFGFYYGLIYKQKKAIIFLLLGIFTHYSVILFVLVYFLYPLLKKINSKSLKYFLLLSLLFIFIPQSIILDIFKGVGLGGAFDVKAKAYLGENTNAEIKKSFAEIFISFFNVIWIYMISFYLLLVKGRYESIFYKILIVLLIFTNVFISIPVVFNRYALFIKLILVLFLINDELKKRRIKASVFFVAIFLIICLNQLIVMRDGLIEIFQPSIQGWGFISRIVENSYEVIDLK